MWWDSLAKSLVGGWGLGDDHRCRSQVGGRWGWLDLLRCFVGLMLLMHLVKHVFVACSCSDASPLSRLQLVLQGRCPLESGSLLVELRPWLGSKRLLETGQQRLSKGPSPAWLSELRPERLKLLPSSALVRLGPRPGPKAELRASPPVAALLPLRRPSPLCCCPSFV